MAIWEEFGMPGKEDENRGDIESERTVLKDGERIINLGGKQRKEFIEGSVRIEESTNGLVVADDGVTTTTDPNDFRYPHIAGKDYQGNLVSAGNFHRCMEKGCRRMVSNLSGVEYKSGHWRCQEHYKKYKLRQFFKSAVSLFYTFEEED